MQQPGTTRTNQASVSAALAAANAAGHSGQNGPLVRAEAGASLADMAQSDLDAALQLLADRAQYITGANGAAIALRRSGNKDMLCRASAGSNVPQIGALLSAEFGLSGESVRTKQPLRCDDTEQDARVNHDVCRQMGIASVAVMPVVNDDEVLGVFELFSGHVNAFGERDLSTLQRLSGMVETAVRLAEASAKFPEQLKQDPAPAVAHEHRNSAPDVSSADAIELELESPDVAAPCPADVPANALTNESSTMAPARAELPLPQPPPASSPAPSVPEIKKPLFWSASLNRDASVEPSAERDQSHVPPVLRSLHKCEACGFPVSEGRSLCVECEEKKWRGQLRGTRNATSPPNAASAAAPAPARITTPAPGPERSLPPQTLTTQMILASAKPASKPAERTPEPSEVNNTGQAPSVPAASEGTALESPLFGAALAPSQSWFSANKYILVALLVVGAAVAAIVLLR